MFYILCTVGYSNWFTDIFSSKVTVNPENQLLMFINYPYQIWSDDPTKIHLTMFLPDFTPAENALVKVNGKVVGEADENGTCIFDYVPGSNKKHVINAAVKKDGKTYQLTKNFSSNSRTASFKLDKLYVYTDRGVYNPGQEIYARIIAWKLKGEYSPVSKAEIQLFFKNSKGKVISGENVSTNEFGIGNAKLPVPKSLAEGEYKLEVLYKKAREETTIRVKKFVPPVIKIEHDMKRYMTDAQEDIKVSGKLSYFSGGKFKGGNLKAEFQTKKGVKVFEKKIQILDNKFNFEISKSELNHIRKGLKLENNFNIVLQIIDNFQQKSKVIWDCFYTARPYISVLELDKDAYQKGEKVLVYAKIVDVDGQPALKIPLKLIVKNMKKEISSTTDDNGVARFEYLMPGHSVTVILKSSIMKAKLAERTIPYQSSKPMNSKVSESPKKSGVKTTVKITFDKKYVPVEKVVHIDLTDISGALVMSDTIPITKGEKGYFAEGEITSKTWGTMLANLYCCAVRKKDFGKPLSSAIVGFVTEGQHITIYPEKKLEIHLDGVPDKVAPGEKIEFSIKTSGGDGEACVGVQIVDDAVISMLNPLLRSPFKHFYNPQAKVIATGGSAVLTWPRVDRNWGSPSGDIAYSNWGWKSPGRAIVARQDYGMMKSKNSFGGADTFAPTNAMEMCNDESDGGGLIESKAIVPKKSMSKPVVDVVRKRGKLNGSKKIVKKPIIVIRKNFPETTLWEPVLVTRDGKVSVTAKIPDSITTQKLTVVVSDKNGFLGVNEKNIKVSKDIFIQVDFPEYLVRGDSISGRIFVKNNTSKKQICNLIVKSDELEFSGENKRNLTLLPDGTVSSEWFISSKKIGDVKYSVYLVMGNTQEKVIKKLTVVPDGIPVVNVISGTAIAKKGFDSSFFINNSAELFSVTASISLPEVFPALDSWTIYKKQDWYSPWLAASTVIMNCAMLEYYYETGKKQKFVDELLIDLKRSAADIQSLQSSDGGWHMYNQRSLKNRDISGTDLYYTMSAIKALSYLRYADIKVDENSIKQGIRYILKHKGKDGFWSSEKAYFWEHFNKTTDFNLSSEIFETLMLATSVLPKKFEEAKELEGIKNSFLKLLKAGINEPMALAATVGGLVYWARKENDAKLMTILRSKIGFLVRMKRKGYWEPHWYHAYGGMVELNARILELLAKVNKEHYSSYLREGVTWLLSTRESWGGWHNEVGTSTAIRALLKAGVFQKEKESRLKLRLNGEPVSTIKVDPSDPFLSVAKLSHIDLDKGLKKGNNKVKVEYDGNLKASVKIIVKQWGLRTDKNTEQLSLIRKTPGQVNSGEPVKIELLLNGRKKYPVLTIVDWIPSNTEVDVNSLEELRKSGKIINYRIDGRKLTVSLEKEKRTLSLQYFLKTIRKGTAFHPGMKVIDAHSGKIISTCVSEALVVK